MAPIVIPDEATFTLWIATADAIFRDELRRPPALHLDPAGLASLLQIAAQGGTAEDMVAAVRQSPEWQALQAAAPPISPPSALEGPSIAGALRGEQQGRGPRLVDDVGPWRWKMATAFDALRLVTTGDFARLRDYCAWVVGIGGNGLRVFGNWAVTGLNFTQVPDYFGHLRSLCLLTRDYGLRMEFCAVCDHIPLGFGAQQQFIQQVADVLAAFDHVVLTLGNEPYQNMENPERFAIPQTAHLLVSRGMCNPNDPDARPYLPSAGFTTYQTVRSADWMRKVGKDGWEIRNGFGGDATHPPFPGTKDACINTEMIGAAETYQQGRRSNDPREFFMAGVAAAMFTSGATMHGDSQTMQWCNVPGPIEAECARQLFRGIDLVPIDAPTWAYARYGPSHPPVPMPVEPDPIDGDGDEVRIHAMVGPTRAVAINYRYLLPGHDAWKPQGSNGWRTIGQDGPCVLSGR